MVILVQLELKNFKTFLDTHTVHFNGKVCVITGPNGGGKSNIADAIAFAMGVKQRDLRVSRMEQLCHASMPAGTGMHVKVLIRSENGDNHFFKRSVMGSNCRYSINDNEVTFHCYEEELKKFNIYAAAKNFCVFQDSIESIMMKNPKERTMIFEEVSGSEDYKPEYDRLKEQLRHYEVEHQNLVGLKKYFIQQINDAQGCRQEAKQYNQLLKENENAVLSFSLFNIYHVKRRIESLKKDMEMFKQKINELDVIKYTKEKKLGKLLNSCESLVENTSQMEENCRTKELAVKKIDDDLVQIREKKGYIEQRVRRCRESYESAKRADEARELNVRDLEEAREKVRREKDKYIQERSDKLGRNGELSESQIEEYEKLRLLASAACADDYRSLGLEREYENLKEIYDNECMKLHDVKDAFERKRESRDFITERIEKLEDAVRKKQENVEMKRAELDQLTATVIESSQLEEEIEKINEEIGDFVYEESGPIRRIEHVRQLRSQFPGVYECLADMCEPIHTRYSLAVAKVLGKNADAIIVDEAKTARDCIEFLREKQLGVYTFLPLDQLRQVRLANHLRSILDPPNVKLVYDVIKFEPAEIAKAVFHATGNALVCETPEDASRVAYEMPKRNNCVSLDGCYYLVSGLISGGNVDLARKAKRWDSQKKQLLKKKKKDLTEKLRTNKKNAPNRSDLELLTDEIMEIEKWLKYPINDLQTKYKELTVIENELKDLEEKKKAQENKVAEVKFNMNKAFEAMNELKLNTETEIFAEFCRRVGVNSIHDYEEEKKSYETKISELDQQIGRIRDQLSYELNNDTNGNVERWKINLEKMTKELESIVKVENEVKSELDKATRELKTVQDENRNNANSLVKTQKNIFHLRYEIASMARKIISLNSNLVKNQHTINEKRAQFHALLKEAKVTGLAIIPTNDETPSSQTEMSVGTVNNTTNNSESESYELEANLEMSFSRLPEELRNLEEDEIDGTRERMEQMIIDQRNQLDSIMDPHMQASQELMLAREKLTETKLKLVVNRRHVKDTRDAFDNVKNARRERLQQFFYHVSNNVDGIYKELTRNQAAQACILADNPEEPYLSGIHYSIVAPNKRYEVNENLSGGEKAMAALPLLFAIQSVDGKKAPFQILDEIDAALDHYNTTKVVKYIKERGDQQSIVITHKKEFFLEADVIIGITSTESNKRLESKVFTVNLSPYANEKSRA